jgi:hypothetical protein
MVCSVRAASICSPSARRRFCPVKELAKRWAPCRVGCLPQFFLSDSCAAARRFWQCPNGKDCMYRHALPPGYVLKSQMKELLAAEAANKVSIEEEIEEQRSKVEAKTPINATVRGGWRGCQIGTKMSYSACQIGPSVSYSVAPAVEWTRDVGCATPGGLCGAEQTRCGS